MIKELNLLANYFKSKYIRIYDGIFILHSRITVIILLACSMFLSLKQYFGEPIHCMNKGIEGNFINSFCWTLGTYILQYAENPNTRHFNNSSSHSIYRKTHMQQSILYEYSQHTTSTSNANELIDIGIGPETATSKRIYLRYYQWVVMILFLQAISFLIPGYLWKLWENRRLNQLCEDLNEPVLISKWDRTRKQMLISYFSSNYKTTHLIYAFKYICCEMFNCIMVLINIILMNLFFSGFWMNYAPAINAMWHYDWKEWNYFSSKIFPKLAKCEFFKFGLSGSQEKYDVLCLLPLNVLNEKLFAFLWIWFIVLLIISSLNILYRLLLLVSPQIRLLLLRAHLRSMKKYEIEIFFNDLNYGDWFLLYKVCCNVNPIVFTDLMQELVLYYKQRLSNDNAHHKIDIPDSKVMENN